MSSMRKNKLMIIGDLHLRDTPPRCRTEIDWWKTMESKLKWLFGMAEERVCPIVCVGDVFDETYRNPLKPSIQLMTMFLRTLSDFLVDFYTVRGNHDFPYHNTDTKHDCPLSCVGELSNNVTMLSDFECEEICEWSYAMRGWDWGDNSYQGASPPYGRGNVAVLHKLCWHKEKPFPEAPDEGNAERIMDELPDFGLIAIGDNHQKFVVEREDQLLINPGSVFRLAADQKDFQPAVFIWHGGTEYEELPIPIEHGVVSDKHIVDKNRKEEAVSEFMNSLKKTSKPADLDFRKELSRVVEGTKGLSGKIKTLIAEAFEEVDGK